MNKVLIADNVADAVFDVFKKNNILTIPNITLNPEFSLSQELSVSKQINKDLTLYGVGFYTRMSNAIVKDSIDWLFDVNSSGDSVSYPPSNTLFFNNWF